MIGQQYSAGAAQRFIGAINARAWEDLEFAEAIERDRHSAIRAFALELGYPEDTQDEIDEFSIEPNPVGSLGREHLMYLDAEVSARGLGRLVIEASSVGIPTYNGCNTDTMCTTGDATVCVTFACSAGCPTSACSDSCAPSTAMGCTPTTYCGPKM